MRDFFPVLILIGRPAAGKSEVIDYLKKMPMHERRRCLHIGPFEEIDDFVWVWQLFEDDDIRDKLGRERLNTTRDYYFKDPFLWNFLIGKINLAFEKKLAQAPGLLDDHTIIVEFARGGENGFGEAFSYFSDAILKRAAILYIDVSYEESLRRNRRRARKGQEDSILYHSLPDDKMETYYRTNDWERLSGSQAQGSIEIKGYHVPFAVFRNEPEKTDDPMKLRPALEQAFGNLWKMREIAHLQSPISSLQSAQEVEMPESARVKMSLPLLMEKKRKKQKITMITSYTYWQANLVDQAGMDIVLVGDSLSMTELGNPSTLPVSMDTMVAHAAAVTRGAKFAFVIGDMPYMTYQPSNGTAIKNAGRFMAEAGCDAIKLEGGITMAERVKAIVDAGIPTMGHLGLTPQSMSALGGFKAQGKDALMAKRIVDDAAALEEAGAFAVLLECVPTKVSKLIAERAKIPIISIGSGPFCDGQLLIFHDMFNMYPAFTPKFAKRYGDVSRVIADGLAQYVREINEGIFPEPQHTFTISDEQFAELMRMLEVK